MAIWCGLFYVPAPQDATRYHRLTGHVTSGALALAARASKGWCATTGGRPAGRRPHRPLGPSPPAHPHGLRGHDHGPVPGPRRLMRLVGRGDVLKASDHSVGPRSCFHRRRASIIRDTTRHRSSGDMQTAQFEQWLRNTAGLSAGTISTRLSNCKRLERYEGDLDGHFDSDGMAHLLARLDYTATDYRRDAPTLHGVPIHGNRRTGTATLKRARLFSTRSFGRVLSLRLSLRRGRSRDGGTIYMARRATKHRQGKFGWQGDDPQCEVKTGQTGSTHAGNRYGNSPKS